MSWRSALLAAFAAGLLAGCADPARDLLQAADELLFAERYLEAAKQYEEVVLETSDRPEADALEMRAAAMGKLAEIRHHFLNDPQGALQSYRAVAELRPGTERAFTARLAMVRLLRDRLGDPISATTELIAVIDAYPARPEIPALRLECAQVAFRAGKYKLALSQVEKLGATDGIKLAIEGGMLKASIHTLEGRHEDALEAYEGLLALPLEPAARQRARFEAARALEELGRLEEAASAYALAAEGSPDRDLVEARIARVRARIDSRAGAQRATRPIAANGTSIRP